MINAKKIDVYNAAMKLDYAATNAALDYNNRTKREEHYQARKDLWKVIHFDPLKADISDDQECVPLLSEHKKWIEDFAARNGYTFSGAIARMIEHEKHTEILFKQKYVIPQ